MLGEALRLIRVYHDMKANELACKLGISASYLSEIEHEKKMPSLALIEKYAEVFETKPSAILLFHEEMDSAVEEGEISLSGKLRSGLRKTARSRLFKLLQVIEDAAHEEI